MLKLRRDDLQLFLIHYSYFCVCFVLIYTGNIEFKIDSKIYSKIESKNDSKLHSKKRLQTPLQKRRQTPLHVLQHADFSNGCWNDSNSVIFCFFFILLLILHHDYFHAQRFFPISRMLDIKVWKMFSTKNHIKEYWSPLSSHHRM